MESTTLAEQVQQPDADVAGRIALGSLPRGAKRRPLVAEFGRFVTVVVPPQNPETIETFISSFPKGSKITARQLRKRGEVRVVEEECKFLAGVEHLDHDDMVELCWVGVPSTPEDFCQSGLQSGDTLEVSMFTLTKLCEMWSGQTF